MCGRYQLNKIPREIRAWFPPTWRWKFPGDITPRFNIAPSNEALVVRMDDGGPVGEMLTWGFRPHWMQQKSKAQINARAESIFETRMFRQSAHARRCLVIADGFYEPKGKPQPRPWYRFHFEHERAFAIGGIWTSWRDELDPYDSFAIVTAAADASVAPIHDRMPLLIDKASYEPWLDPNTPQETTMALCRPTGNSGLLNYQVSDYARNARNDGPECISPV